jgi:hypothetical protein
MKELCICIIRGIDNFMLRVPMLRELAKKCYSDYILTKLKKEEVLLCIGEVSETFVAILDVFPKVNEDAVANRKREMKAIENKKKFLIHIKPLPISSNMQKEFEAFKQCKYCDMACYESHIRMYEVDRVRNSSLQAICSLRCAETDQNFHKRTMYRYASNVNID